MLVYEGPSKRIVGVNGALRPPKVLVWEGTRRGEERPTILANGMPLLSLKDHEDADVLYDQGTCAAKRRGTPIFGGVEDSFRLFGK